jgi:hypothetical protein
MSEIKPNIQLLDSVMLHIETNPEQWDQTNWRCGTKFCFAGHAAIMSGWKPVQDDTDLWWRLQGWHSAEEARQHFQRAMESDHGLLKNNPDHLAENEKYWGERLALVETQAENRSDTVQLSDGEQGTICQVATEVLGLDDETAGVLFGSTNTLQNLRDMIQEIKETGHLDELEWEDRVESY